MKRLTNIAINAVLVIVSTAVVLFVADLILKELKLPSKYRAIQLLSGSKLYTDESGVRRYEPSKDVEQAALAEDEISYRYKYRTNNLGFVSKYDHLFGRPLDLAIVGDSVSEGQEVGPWLDVVQQDLWERHGRTSQNLAIAGNGFVDFERGAAYAKSILGARKVMVIFIGGDMHRPGSLMLANEDCSTYKAEIDPNTINCFSGNSTWHHYDGSLSDDELVRFAESRQRFGLSRLVRPLAFEGAITMANWLCKTGFRLDFEFWLARRYNSQCGVSVADDDPKAHNILPQNTSLSLPNSPEPPTMLIPAYTITALEKILHLYGTENVMLVAIPGGGYSIRAQQPEAVFNHLLGKHFNSPIQFVDLSESCDMPRKLWAPREGGGPRKGYGHPTAEGYRKLQSCILTSERVMKFARH